MFEPVFISVVRGFRVRGAVGTAALSAILGTAACHKMPPRVFVPPVIQRPAPQPLRLPENLSPPELPAEAASPLELAALSTDEFEIGPPPPQQPQQVARPKPPVIISPKPVAPAPIPEPAPPKIALILPAEQQRAYNRELDDILERDQKTLETVARRNLNANMRDKMAQIRELLTQAKQAREQDLLTSVNLARHADTLAKDLLDRLP